MLEVRNVEKRYAGRLALRDVSLEVPAGEVHVVVGPNGAGKSTLLGIVAGVIRPGAGQVLIGGVDIFGARAPTVRRHMAFLPENCPLYNDLRVEVEQGQARLLRPDGSSLTVDINEELAINVETGAAERVARRLVPLSPARNARLLWLDKPADMAVAPPAAAGSPAAAGGRAGNRRPRSNGWRRWRSPSRTSGSRSSTCASRRSRSRRSPRPCAAAG